MAEAFLSKMAGEHFEVYSAGFKPQPIHPYTYQVMQEIGYDTSKMTSKNLWDLAKTRHFGIIITVCKKAEQECPTLQGVSTRFYWEIEDPAEFEGTEDQKLAKFREVRDQILEYVKGFLKERKISAAS